MNSNATPFPALKPGFHLAPAAIGRSDETPQIVGIFCPDYCVEDHVAARQVAVEDIVHSSETAHTAIRSFLSSENVIELYVTIKSEASTSDPRLHAAHVVLDDGSDDAFLTPEMADNTADDLYKLAAKLREAARTARLHNAAGDSDPDMDEALLRVRGGVA